MRKFCGGPGVRRSSMTRITTRAGRRPPRRNLAGWRQMKSTGGRVASVENDAAVRMTMNELRRIVRIIRESARGAEKVGGVSGAQVFVMHCLQGGPRTITELARATMTHQSSVSVVVQRLVDRELVTRGVADGDRRRR